jgi:N-acyl-phosphatidylethanolamine-hydrolysing phospholipase D
MKNIFKNKRLLIVICYLLFVIWFSGCGYLSIVINNFGDSVFKKTKKVDNKIKAPYNKDVKMSVLWGGHSTMLLQLYDKVIIFDPFFNNRLGGVFLRRVETGLDRDDLTKLDLIFVSHSHMDHFCFSSIGELSDKFPKAKLLFPYGVEDYMPPFDLDMIRVDNRSVTRDNIGKSIYVDSIKVTPVYAAHTGGRYALDTYTWKVNGSTGYIIEYKGICVYFAGDTGYDSVAFKNIGNKFNIDLALIPVGPCRTCDSVGFKHHTSSIETLELFRDLKAKQMIPMHYGALKYIKDENLPIEVMQELLNTSKYSDLKSKIKILNIGEQVILN